MVLSTTVMRDIDWKLFGKFRLVFIRDLVYGTISWTIVGVFVMFTRN